MTKGGAKPVEHDAPLKAIARYAATAEELDEQQTRLLTRHYLDAMGCAVGGWSAGPSRISRELAATAATPDGCSVLGLARTVAAEQAVFAAVCMVRQLDFNDSLRGGGHPSDMMPALIAAAELVDASGQEALRGMAVSYEVFAALSESYELRDAGWDQGPFIAVSTAAGVGSVLQLDQATLAEAVSMALTPNLALHVTRTGELSNWKGCATAHAAMTGLFAARLAMLGMTGPPQPFEGTDGLHRHVPPRRALLVGPQPGRLSAIERCTIKRYPAVIHTQGVIEALLSARQSGLDPSAIERITIDTYHASWFAVGGGGDDREQKWHPLTRETADHSLPYVAALSLIDGDVRVDGFAPERLTDPRLLALMDRTVVRSRPDLTALFPGDRRSVIAIALADGRTREITTTFALGTPQNPMTEADLDAKFDRLAAPILGAEASAELRAAIRALPTLTTVRDLAALYRQMTPAPLTQ